uniref:Viral macrophage inflammatory protein 2 n=1 Tax=Human herpesvirus 8 type P (isolate GK18) TaxID=868565 RepID=UPI0005AECEFA|nr:Chain C, Viral macrophage inflammatory protein 2 [Human herpesvirus 8 strain GK18]
LGASCHRPDKCCLGYQKRPLPQVLLSSWYPTSQLCSKPGVIFLTKRGRQVCADKSKDWVKKLMQQLPVTARYPYDVPDYA